MSYAGDELFTEQGAGMPALGGLRSQLLESVESGSREKMHEVACRFNRLFTTHFCAEDVERPAVFRDMYQVLSYPLKIKSNYTQQQKEAYVAKFATTEAETRAWKVNGSNPVSRLARYLLRTAARTLDLSPQGIECFVRHGPGAVMLKEQGSDKNFFLPPPAFLEKHYPYEMFFANVSLFATLRSDSEREVYERFVESRLSLVPKDWKGPRGVFISPKEAIFCQLGVDRAIKDLTSRSWLGDVWSPKDQRPSQAVAHEGSYAGTYATLDLSDASDRIPLALVGYLFNRPDYLRLCATRPAYVHLPDGSKHKLAMFAPMGDGKTFAVLTFIVSALCLAAMMDKDGVLAARPVKDVSYWSRRLRVFGDDIAVDSRYYDAVVSALETHNLKVNKGKSFVKGPFREACGYDCFAGVDVTPLRQRVNVDSDEDTLDACVAFHNRIATRYSHLSRLNCAVRDWIVQRYRNKVSYSRDIISAPTCLFDWNPLHRNMREGHAIRYSDLQRFEVRSLAERRVISFPESLDPTWDLNYSLFPKGKADARDDDDLSSYAPRRRCTVMGSPSALVYLNRHLEALGMSLIPKPRVFRTLEWRPVGVNP